MNGLRRSPTIQVVWFKRDLRVVDHAPLSEAARLGPVLPLYIAEPELWRNPDASARQWSFAHESIRELQVELAALGQPLVIRVGETIAVLDRLRQALGPIALWSHQETGNAWTYARDRAVRGWARAQDIPWIERPQHGVIRGLASRDGWAARWDRFMALPPTTPPLALPPLAGIDPGSPPSARDLGLADDLCPDRQRGGRRAALALIDSFFADRGANYHQEMSSPNTAYRACSRLSAHFAAGTLSIREAHQACRARLDTVRGWAPSARQGWPAALRAFDGRLHWHCHFIQKLEDQPTLETIEQHPAYVGIRGDNAEPDRLDAWASGHTGFPFVDACMRALSATGWINFRMRAMLAAFATYHLWLPWRPPALHLARQFVDYEPGIHYPQMQMQSGITGINTPRIYNPVKQSRDQDPDGWFIRRYIPELRALTPEYVHEPWTMPVDVQHRTGCVIGKHYPVPIVDHLDAARQARQAIWAVRRGDAFRATAAAIQDKHGSRKSGLPPSNPSRRGRRRPDQLRLDV